VEPTRWIRGMVPVAAAALLSAGVVTRPPVLVAAEPPWQPPPCTDGGPPSAVHGPAAAAWYRLDGLLDDSGTLTGTRLSTGLEGGVTRRLELPPESFASGPVKGVVVVGADDGSRSRVSLLDVVRGCTTVVGDEGSVVRSALLAPDGSWVAEHRVDRVNRADLGVWRVPIEGGHAVRIVAPAPQDDRYGQTFTTELRWAPDGRIAVTSCGARACRTRLVEPRTGRSIAVGPTGPVVGIDPEGGVVAFDECVGFPCPLLRHDPNGRVRVLAGAAGRAAMAGRRVVFQNGDDGLRVIDLTSGSMDAVAGADDLVPLGDGSLAAAGVERGPDDVLLAGNGRVDGTRSRILGPVGVAAASVPEVRR
jgi:hypothetical protein